MIISIIMPVYNNEGYLSDSINSVLRQRSKAWELIIVNDGSTDCTGKICDEYAKKDNRIKVIHTQNYGPADARNIGIQNANGKYCIFLDSDDQLDSEAISALSFAVIIEDFEIVFYGYSHNIDTGQNKWKSIEHSLAPQKYYTNKEFKEIYSELSTQGFTHPAWNKMFLTSFLKDHLILFPSGIFISEDYIFNLTAYSLAERVLILEEVLYHYVSRNFGSITTSFRLNKIKDIEQVYIKSYQLMKNWQPVHLNKINNEFIQNISIYINSLYSADCELSKKEKKNLILKIINNENVKKCIYEIYTNNLRNRIITSLLKIKKVSLLLFTGKVSQYLRR